MHEGETTYRVAAATVLLIGVAIRFYYQAKLRGIARDEARGKRRDEVFYYVVLASFLLTLVYSFSTALDFAHVQAPSLVRWLGVVVGILAQVLFVWCHHELGRNWSGILQLSENHQLVVGGPYRYVPHPMYSALFLAAFSYALITANWLIALTCVGSVWLMYRARIDDEESMMLSAFGEQYQELMRSTGRLIPRLRTGAQQRVPADSPRAARSSRR